MSDAGPGRAGRYVRQSTGYRAFLPAPLPPAPPLRFEAELVGRLAEAERALGRLDAATEFLPNPDLFVAMYVRKEAVLSSQIEGTQASMADLLEHEARGDRPDTPGDVREVWNYVRAMNHGLERLQALPLSLRLLREIHGELLQGVRGSERSPGEFRRSQNWIGPAGCTLAEAAFVPPPPQEVQRCMGELETFLHRDHGLPLLVRVALAHVQFEMVHPFLDGNGRVGRLLITFLLCWHGVLRRPTLYLSYYFKQRRQEYYDRLRAAHDQGDFEGWVGFFLEGVRQVSLDGTAAASRIQQLREDHRALVAARFPTSSTASLLLDHLFRHPVVTVKAVSAAVGRTRQAANSLVAEFEDLGLLREVTGQRRNRVYRYEPYLQVFGEVRP